MKWWSVSKQTWLDLAEMNDFHLRSAFLKLERSEYRIHGHDGEPSVGEVAEMSQAFRAEFARRGLGERGGRPDPPAAS